MRPIWESASRPLFVRSVWQEAIGRRHFILDYEPRQRQRWKRQKTRLRGEYKALSEDMSFSQFLKIKAYFLGFANRKCLREKLKRLW